MYHINKAQNKAILFISLCCCVCFVAAATTLLGMPGTSAAVATGGLHVQVPAASSATSSTRQLQQGTMPPSDLQQAMQRMLAVPIATPHSVLALGYKGLEADTLRNWHLLARKLGTQTENITVVTFGGSLTAGYLAGDEGSWVEQLVAWLKVSCCDSQMLYYSIIIMSVAQSVAEICV
jgi:hypothetical protein